jgi:hypothetical protein
LVRGDDQGSGEGAWKELWCYSEIVLLWSDCEVDRCAVMRWRSSDEDIRIPLYLMKDVLLLKDEFASRKLAAP